MGRKDLDKKSSHAGYHLFLRGKSVATHRAIQSLGTASQHLKRTETVTYIRQYRGRNGIAAIFPCTRISAVEKRYEVGRNTKPVFETVEMTQNMMGNFVPDYKAKLCILLDLDEGRGQRSEVRGQKDIAATQKSDCESIHDPTRIIDKRCRDFSQPEHAGHFTMNRIEFRELPL